MFMVSMVPLRVVIDSASTSKNLQSWIEVWKNERPSSVRYCRPREFSYSKETPELILEKHRSMKEEIQNLTATVYNTKYKKKIQIFHNMQLTMVDGKVVQAISGSKSSSSCTVCHDRQK